MAEVTISLMAVYSTPSTAYCSLFRSTKSLASVVTTGNKSAIIRRNTTRSQTPIAFNFTKEQVAFFETFSMILLVGESSSFTHPRKTTIEVSFDPSQEEVYTIEPQDNMSFLR